jgi:hypothetical protein
MPVPHDIDTLYETCELEQTTFDAALDELVELGLVQKETTTDDATYYKSRQGLSWSEVVHLDSPAKKQILLCLIDNPKTFFVLYNTQKGKLRIAAEEIRSWATVPDKRVVAFLCVDNRQDLANQSVLDLFDVIGPVGKKFLLISNTADNVDTIKDAIDSYAAFGGKMPVVTFLSNPTQTEKVKRLLEHIRNRMATGLAPGLRYGIVFDEADKVYPPCRGRFADLLVNDDRALHRIGFVSATEGDLLDAEYPECANAYMYQVPDGHPGYRAFHTEDAEIKKVVHRTKDNNDAYAEGILETNREHFSGTVTLKNGTQGFRKVIVNSAAKRSSMTEFARRRNAEGAYAVTVNMNGICVYRPGHEMKKYSAKGQKFGHLLFNVYVELGLHDKPLFCIGRRKVDRGLGFHWAPRDGSNGLIWTDMILGRIDDKDSAVQKAGRLAGVVEQCPQYPGKLTWWTDEKTAALIIRHNNIVDGAGEKRGCSALQAVSRADAEAGVVAPPVCDYALSSTFATSAEAEVWCERNLTYGKSVYGLYDEEGNAGTTHIKYRGALRALLTEAELRASVDMGQGANTSARVMPVTDVRWGIADSARVMPVAWVGVPEGADKARVMPVSATEAIAWVVIYKKDKLRIEGGAQFADRQEGAIPTA